MLAGGGWFRSQSEFEDFNRYQILEGQFQWFINIVSYLHFVTGGTVSTLYSQRDEFHAVNVWKTKEKYIFISAFNTDIPPILGGLG